MPLIHLLHMFPQRDLLWGVPPTTIRVISITKLPSITDRDVFVRYKFTQAGQAFALADDLDLLEGAGVDHGFDHLPEDGKPPGAVDNLNYQASFLCVCVNVCV